MPLFIAASQHCAIREDNGNYIFHDPSNPTAQAIGNWQEVALLAVRILVEEARRNGGVPGVIFTAAETYAKGITSGKITESNEEFAAQLLTMIEQLKAM